MVWKRYLAHSLIVPVRLLLLHKLLLCFLMPPLHCFSSVRSGSVIADFAITFNNSNFDLIEELNQSVSSTGHLYNMPLTLQQLTPKNGEHMQKRLIFEVLYNELYVYFFFRAMVQIKRIAVIAVESAVNQVFLCFKRHTNEATWSIQSRLDPFTSFVCQTTNNFNNSK